MLRYISLLYISDSGPIGQKLLSILKQFGSAVQYKSIDAQQLTSITDSQLSFALRDVRTIIIAADNIIPEKKGWFGSTSTPEDILTPNALNKLLNAMMKEREKNSDIQNIKVIALGKAISTSRGAASFLMGDTTDIDDEIILKCQKRLFGYFIVKVGEVIPDDSRITTSAEKSSSDYSPILSSIPFNLKVNTLSSSSASVNSKVRVSDACEALLRGVAYPTAGNCTVTLSSRDPVAPGTDVSSSSASPGYASKMLSKEEYWDDELLKTDGPELLRVPLLYASVDQAALRLGRVAESFQVGKPSYDARVREGRQTLVTPVEVNRYTNGIRILFRPKDSGGYSSSKEEKAEEAARAVAAKVAAIQSKRPSGYISPEAEKKMQQQQQEDKNDKSNNAVTPKKPKPEGGLEILVENSPYRRVRVKRCEMGPSTIVKEESEEILLKALSRCIADLEDDYKKMLNKSLGQK